MQVAIGQDKSNGLVTFNQVEVLFFNFFFPPCQNVTTLEFRLLLLKKFRRSQGDKCPPRPPLVPPMDTMFEYRFATLHISKQPYVHLSTKYIFVLLQLH